MSERLIDEAHDLERLGQRDEARATYERALRALDTDSAPRLAASILRWIARTYQGDARFDDALDCLSASLAVAEAHRDGAGTGHGINLLAIIRWQQGDLDEARRLYLRAREHAVRAGESKLAAMTALNLGVIASVRGDFEQAQRYYENSLREYRTLALPHDICVALNNLGLLHTHREAWQEAEVSFREALQIAEFVGDLDVGTQIEVNLAAVAVNRGDLEVGEKACARALDIATQRRSLAAQADAHKLSGMVARDVGAHDAAEAHFAKAAEIAEARTNTLLIAEVERERALLFRMQGRNRETLQSLNRSHRLFLQLQARHDLADVERHSHALEAEFVEVARRWGESTESKDRYTQGHCERVADTACRLASIVGFDDKAMFWFRIGALLHDVGKLIIPSEVLNKPGRLSKDEWELIKRHPTAGVELLSEVEFPWDVLPIVRSHHECWDGSGYPEGLVGENIPLVARIVCLADVYDALTTERSYKKALTHIEAISMMREDVGRQFDPELFATFERAMEDHGTLQLAPTATLPIAGVPNDGHGFAVDDLTGLVLRRGFTDWATAAITAALERSESIAFAVVDIDHFKQVNDTFGHLQGDDVLRTITGILRTESRTGDIVGRYAGDEFMILLPDTSLDAAGRVLDRMREQLERRRIPLRQNEEGHVSVSLSAGVAAAPIHGTTFESLFAAADRALYVAKRSGRNTVAKASANAADGASRLEIQCFIGRDDELRRMVTHLESAVCGEPMVCAIVGEAGVGKTTLVERLAPEVRLRTGSFVVSRSLEPDVRPPYGVWVEVVEQIHRLRLIPSHEWPELRRLVPALRKDGEVEGSEVSGGKYALLDELTAYLRLASRSRTLVIVLDDVQWADIASWDALEHLLAQLGEERLMICLTIRREDAEHVEANRRRLSRSPRYDEIRLTRLSREHVSEWVSKVLQQAEVDEELARFLYDHTEGNPLFVEQALRTLEDEGAIWYAEQRWEWKSIETLGLPAAVEDLMARRLSHLSPSASKILTIAAIIGRSFDVEILKEAADVEEEILLSAIDEGIAANVVDATRTRDGAHFAFTHGQLADALRRAANPRRLAQMHLRLAQILEQRRPESLTEIASHYDHSLETEPAYRFAMMAGERAASVYALDDAIVALRIAVRRAATPPDRIAARLRLIDVARIAGRYEEAETVCGELLAENADLSRTTELHVRRVHLQLRVLQNETPAETLRICRRLLTEAGIVGDVIETVVLTMMLSEAHSRRNEWEAAEYLANGALQLADGRGHEALRADALTRLGTTLLERSPSQALERFALAHAIYSARGDRYGEVRCLVNSGIAYARLNDRERAEAAYGRASELADQAHIPDLGGLAALNLGVLLMTGAAFESAAEAFARSLRLFTKVRNEPRRVAAIYNQAHLAREQGDVVLAGELYDSACVLAEQLGANDIQIGATAGAGLTALALGAPDDVVHCTSRLTTLLQRSTADWYQGRELTAAFEVRRRIMAGDLRGASSHLADVVLLAAQFDKYAELWLIADCVPMLAKAGCAEVSELASRALIEARALNYELLATRLTYIADDRASAA